MTQPIAYPLAWPEGSHDKMARLNRAIEAARKELGA